MGAHHSAGRRITAAVRQAAVRAAEQLESRTLLSDTALPGPILAAVPRGLRGVADGGRLGLAVSPVAGRYTPHYVQLDPAPAVTAAGTLAPFATAGPTGLSPARMRHAYGVDQVMFGSVVGDGAGQTIAIVDAYDYPTAAADLHAFDVAFNLPDPPTFAKVNQTGGTALPGVDPAGTGNSWAVEAALDLEWAHAMAPAANLLLVEATSNTDADLVTAAVGYARSAPGVVAVSMSFGRSETTADPSINPTFTTPAGHAGVTFLASTGDYGTPAGFPAYSPNVVAVGGTTLTTDAAGNYTSETGWSGSGGGVSAYEAQPAYQAGVVTQSTAKRTAPDVSFDADPNTGASVYDSYDFGAATPWLTVGGTSLSAPCVAGLVAVADQGRTLAGGLPLDGVADALPKLYAMPAAGNFHDVTAGSNGYAAGVGYDLVTGRGTPVANAWVNRLAAAGPFVTAATPAGVVTAAPSAATFTFSAAMDPASFDPAADIAAFTGPGGADLRSSITGFAWGANNTTLAVTFVAPAASGAYALTVGPDVRSAGGVAMDQNQNGVPGEATDTFTDAFQLDPNPLAVASTTPAAGGLLSGASPTLSVRFNQPVDPATVSPSDLTLGRGAATAASVSTDGTTVTFTLGGLTSDGAITAAIAAGAIGKPDGNSLRSAFSGAYVVDLPTLPLPTPFAPLTAAGPLAYAAPAVADSVYAAGDTHGYTVALAAGQRLTVTATTAAALQGRLTLLDPAGNAVATAVAAAAGQPVALQALPVSSAGTYTIVAGGVGATAGAYTLTVMLNAAAEQQGVGGAAHATVAAAQDLDAAATPLPGGAGRREAVAGAVQPSVPTGPATLFADTFESGLGGITLSNAAAGGLWHVSAGRGTQSGHSATQSLYFGAGETAAGGGTYNTGVRAAGTATTPGIALPASPAAAVSFNYVLATEGNASYDKAQLQVSADGGTTFTTVASYNAVAESATWKAATASLAAYAGKTVQLRWSFDTVDGVGNAYEGWYVDDVAVTAASVAQPVPAVYAVTLAAGDTLSLGLRSTGTFATSGLDLTLLDGNGAAITAATAATAGFDRAVADYVAPAAGTYYARVTGAIGSGYGLTAAVDASLAGTGPAAAGVAAALPLRGRTLNGSQQVVGRLASAAQRDYHRVYVSAGQSLTVTTATPFDAAGVQPGNAPALALAVVDPATGAAVSTGVTVTPAPDGRNQTLTFAAAAPGYYAVAVGSTAAGDYVLTVTGAVAAAPALTGTVAAPAAGSAVNAVPTVAAVTFSGPFDARTLAASLLTVDGVPATAVVATGPASATFTLPAAVVGRQGTHTFNFVPGSLVGLSGGVLAASSQTFTLDTVAPTVVASSIAAGGTVAAGPLTYTATFSEPMLAANLDASDVALYGKLTGTSYTPASVAFSADNTVLTVTYAALPESTYTLTLLTGTGRFQDAAGNSLAFDYAVAFDADAATRAVPTPLTPVAPLGSLAYTGTTSGAITKATDVDAFTIPLAAGQTLTVLGTPQPNGLWPTVSVVGPDGTTLASTTATGAGKTAIAQTVLATTAGTYTVTIGGAAVTIGTYSVAAYVNAAVEAEAYGGTADDTPATAQAVNAAVQPLPGAAGVTRGAVVGAIDAALSADVYAVTLAAGSTSTFAAYGSGRPLTLTVTDAAGTVLLGGTASSGTTAGGTLVTSTAAADFTPLATGTYYLRVTGTSAGAYTLLTATEATIEADPNDATAAPQAIDPTGVVLGAIAGTADVDLYAVNAPAGATLTVSTLTPGPGDTLGVAVQLYDPAGTLVAAAAGNAADGHNALLTFTTATAGTYRVRLAAAAAAVPSAAASGEYLLAVSADTRPPRAPLAPALSAAADTGVSAADGVTNFNDATAATALQFAVGRTVAGDTVELFVDGVLAGTATATGTTTTVTATPGTPLADGVHTVTARQVDPAAGESVDSLPVTVTVRTATPATPAAPALTPASDSGTAGDGLTNVAAPTFTVAGVSTPYFRVYRDGTLVSGPYATGTTFTSAALADGTYAFAVAAVDAAGNASAPGPATVVTLSTVPPTAPTAIALDPASDTGVSATDGVTSVANPTVDVTVVGPGTLNVAIDGRVVATVPVTAAGAVAVPVTYPTSFGGYAPSTAASVATGNVGTATADLNGDGVPDLIMGVAAAQGPTVLLGKGDGTFAPGVVLPGVGSGSLQSVIAADLDGDGKVDLIAGTTAAGPQVYYGNGDGTFAAPVALGGGAAAYRLAVGDVDGDGRLDLITAGGTTAAYAYRATGPRAFATPTTVSTNGSYAQSIAVADLNGDGRADLALTTTAGTLLVALATGGGAFGTPAALPAVSGPTGLAIADLTGDGRPDLAVLSSLSASTGAVYLFPGRGDGTFSVATGTVVTSYPQSLAVADLNDDGRLDVAVVGGSGSTSGISYLLGTGGGAFATAVSAASIVAQNLTGLSVADFNRDGRPDLAYVGSGAANVLLATVAGATDGTHTFSAWMTNAAGTKSATVFTNVTLDRAAPATPTGLALTTASDTGSSATDGITSVAAPTFAVTGGGPYYRIYRDGTPVTDPYATATTFTSAPLADGTYAFTVVAVDAAGNVSAALPWTVTVDTAAPATPAAPALTAASETGVSFSDGITSVTTPTLAVTGGGPYFRVYRNGTLVSGTYAVGTTFTSAALADGTYAFAVAAVDAAGNASAVGPAVAVTVLTKPYGTGGDVGYDATFGTGGTAVTNPTGFAGLAGVAVATDGRVYAVGTVNTSSSTTGGSLGLARYTAAGAADPTFGVAGLVTYKVDAGCTAYAVAVQPDGKVVVVGGTDGYAGFVARFNVDGSPDPSFGTGGVFRTAGNRGLFQGVALQPNGSIVAVGNYGLGVTRLTPAGQADATFGTGGTALVGGGAALFSVVVQPDGKLVAAGYSLGSGTAGQLVLARFTTAGQPDATFGTNGVTLVQATPNSSGSFGSLGYALALQADGKPVMAAYAVTGGTATDPTLQGVAVRFTPAGALDATFGTAGGIVPLTALGSTNYPVQAIAVRPDGHILIGGTGYLAGRGTYTPLLLELNADGSTTTTFGTNGAFAVPVTSLGGIVAGLALQPDGSLIVGQRVTLSNNIYSGGAEFAVHRLLLTTALTAPRLTPASDSGTAGDGVTNVATPTLAFPVPAGYYARVYRNGTLVSGNYLAGGTFTSAPLADGTYAFTYAVVDAAGNVSAASPAATVTVDTVRPTVTLAAIPNTAGVATAAVTFSEPVDGLLPTSFTLSRNGGPDLLDGTQTLTTTDHVHWTLGNLAKYDAFGGTYTLTVAPAAGSVTDAAGNALTATASQTFTVPSTTTATADGQQYYFRLDPAGTAVQLWVAAAGAVVDTAAAPTTTFPLAGFAGVAVNGGGHARVTVTLDDANGILPTTYATFFDGGVGAVGDALVIRMPPGGALGASSTAGVYVGAGTDAQTSTPVFFAHVDAVTFRGTAGGADHFEVNGNVGGTTLLLDGGGGGDSVAVNGGAAKLAPGAWDKVVVNGAPTVPATLTVGTGPAGGGIAVTHIGYLGLIGTLVAATAATPADRTLLVVDFFGLNPAGRLDVGGNDLVIRGNQTIANLTNLVGLGFAGGTWAGPYIRSSAAAADAAHLHAVGVIANATGDAAATTPLYAAFDGSPTAASDLLLKYTYYGDLNLDGVVDAADYTRIDAGFLLHLTGWANGDVNYDGVVDASDYTLMDNAFNQQRAAPPAAPAARPAAAPSAVTPPTETSRGGAAAPARPAASGSAPNATTWADDDRRKRGGRSTTAAVPEANHDLV